MAIQLKKGQKKDAEFIAQTAWKGFSGYGDVFYPDDLRHLLEPSPELSSPGVLSEAVIDQFMDLMDSLTPSTDLDTLLTQVIAATNRFFGAERGGLFFFSLNTY